MFNMILRDKPAQKYLGKLMRKGPVQTIGKRMKAVKKSAKEMMYKMPTREDVMAAVDML